MIKKLIKTNTLKQAIIVLPATIINAFLGIIFYILVARILSPADFGIFSLCIAFITTLISIADIGTDTGIIRFVGQNIKDNRQKAFQFLKLGLKIKVFASCLIAIFLWFLIPSIADLFFNKPELITPLRISIFGIFSSLLFSFATAAFQSLQKFSQWSILNISMNALRLIILILLLMLGVLQLISSIYIYIIIPFLGFLIAILFLPKFWLVKNENNVAVEFFKFNKWIAIISIIASITSRLDTFLSTKYLTLNDVGIYSVAVVLSGILVQVSSSIATIAAPKFSGFKNNKEAKSYLFKLQGFIGVLCALVLIFGIPLSYIFIPIFYGMEYQSSIAPFVVLLFAQLVFLFSMPIHISIFYYFSHPKLFVYMGIINLFLILIVGSILIPNYSYVGAAITVLISNILSLIIPVIWVFNKFKK